MLRILARGGGDAADPTDPAALWIDMENPTPEEETGVEAALGIDVLTPAERGALEESARFYEENAALYLTATLLGRRDEGAFVSGPVSFILARAKLVTVRQIKPRAFEIGQGRASARIGASMSAPEMAMALWEGASERLADLLGEVSRETARLSSTVFAEDGPAPDLRVSLRALGRNGALAAMTHDSLSSLLRLVAFARHAATRHDLDEARLIVLARDIAELERQAEALQERMSFLQDATLGLVNAGQADVVKALSVATVLFVPPNLVASIFGMNFDAITWFRQPWGPWAGFALMLAAPAALMLYAKWRRWF